MQPILQRNAARKGSLETFAVKLLDKVINAPSPAAIDRYIAVAIRALDQNKVNGYIIQRFIDRVTLYLNNYTPSNTQQEENSRMAKIRLQEFRQEIAMPSAR